VSSSPCGCLRTSLSLRASLLLPRIAYYALSAVVAAVMTRCGAMAVPASEHALCLCIADPPRVVWPPLR
jgi:hypothetical protein